MKQNITISVEKSLLRKARTLAAQRGASVSAMLAQELLRIPIGKARTIRRGAGHWRGCPRHSISAAANESSGTPVHDRQTFVESNALIDTPDADAGPTQQRATDQLTELWNLPERQREREPLCGCPLLKIR